MTTQQIERIRAQIESAKTDKAKAEGLIEQSLKRLKEEFDCVDIASANELLESLSKQIDTLSDKLKKIETEIEDALEKIEESK